MAGNRSLRKEVFSLAAANAVDYALQFIVPVVVARALSPEEFGGYRMVWLVAATVLAFAPLHTPQSLSYFLPRVERGERPTYIANNAVVLLLLSLLGAATVNPWHPLLPLHWLNVGQPLWFYPVFVFLWVFGLMTDWLPISDGRTHWQAATITILSLSRTLLIGATAWYTRDLHAVLMAMVAFSVVKVGASAFYMLCHYRLSLRLKWSTMASQFRYALPFGIGEGVYLMRQQAEQWVTAALFNARDFATFSLGNAAAPLFTLIRQSVHNAVFPRLSELHARKDHAELAALNRKATSSVAFLLLPAATALWVYADEVISLIYTPVYKEAAGVMRVYLVGVIPQMVESTVLLRVGGYGTFGLVLSLVMLPLTIAISYLGILQFGLPGGAIGSVVCAFLSHAAVIYWASKKLRISPFSLYDFRAMTLYLTLSALAAFIGDQLVVQLGFTAFARFLLGSFAMAVIFLCLAVATRTIPASIATVMTGFVRKILHSKAFLLKKRG